MKSLLVLSAIVMSSTAFSAEFLLQKRSSSGFMPVPTSRVLNITENGKATEIVTNVLTKKSTKKVITELSPNVVQAIKDNIDLVNPKAKIVDLDANKPRCMDAPSYTYTIKKDNKDVVIGSWNSCHKSQMKSKAVTALLKIVSDVENTAVK